MLQLLSVSANLTLPSEGEDSPFKEIEFVELQREEATALVEKYNKVRARTDGFPRAGSNTGPHPDQCC